MARILIGITGGIAAYKAASVVSVLKEKGNEIRVIMTESAKKFVAPITFSALSGSPVLSDDDFFSPDGHIHHIEAAQWADRFVICPATYNFMSKLKHQIADDLLTSTVAAYSGRLIVCPAMNTIMWGNLSLHRTETPSNFILSRDNDERQIKDLPRDARVIMLPGEGRMACGTQGPGKLRPTKEIIEFIERSFSWPI